MSSGEPGSASTGVDGHAGTDGDSSPIAFSEEEVRDARKKNTTGQKARHVPSEKGTGQQRLYVRAHPAFAHREVSHPCSTRTGYALPASPQANWHGAFPPRPGVYSAPCRLPGHCQSKAANVPPERRHG